MHSVQSRFQLRLPDETGLVQPLLRTIGRATWEGLSLSFSLRANTGRLYSIRSGRDHNGDQSSRDRLPRTSRNSETGPANWNLDLTLTKDVLLGGAAIDGDEGRSGRGSGRFRRDSSRLRFQARINNVLNRSQPRAYASIVTSPLFGLPTGYTGGRTITLATSIDF